MAILKPTNSYQQTGVYTMELLLGLLMSHMWDDDVYCSKLFQYKGHAGAAHIKCYTRTAFSTPACETAIVYVGQVRN